MPVTLKTVSKTHGILYTLCWICWITEGPGEDCTVHAYVHIGPSVVPRHKGGKVVDASL